MSRESHCDGPRFAPFIRGIIGLSLSLLLLGRSDDALASIKAKVKSLTTRSTTIQEPGGGLGSGTDPGPAPPGSPATD